MQKREQLSAKLLQSGSIAGANLNDANRLLSSSYRKQSAATIDAGVVFNGNNSSSNGTNVNPQSFYNSNIHSLMALSLKKSNTTFLNGAQLNESQNFYQQQQQQQLSVKNSHDSSKFFEEILSQRRKSAETYNTNSNQYVTSSTIQSLQNLPSNNTSSHNTGTGRTSEERALYPDKLILDR